MSKTAEDLKKQLKSQSHLGVVVEDNDPYKRGKVKIRVFRLFENMPVDDLPWATPIKNNTGTTFSTPGKGKLVYVCFEDGDWYMPYYESAEHYNINLQRKLESLTDSQYQKFFAISFDGKTEMFVEEEEEGLVMDHVKSNINIRPNGDIKINLRDNQSKLYLGSPDADEAAVLGNRWMTWFDEFVKNLQGAFGGPYLGNLGGPVAPHPKMLQVLSKYQSIRPTFLSDHVFIVDDRSVKPNTRPFDQTPDVDDNWNEESSDIIPENSKIQRQSPPNVIPGNKNPEKLRSSFYTPQQRPDTGKPQSLPEDIPPDTYKHTVREPANKKEPEFIIEKYENGRVPLEKMKISQSLDSFLSREDGSAYLVAQAADDLDLLMNKYEKEKETTWNKIIFTDGYRSFQRQEAMKRKLSNAPDPGESDHGWGIAVDLNFGFNPGLKNDISGRKEVYNSPEYQWLVENAPKFGWHNPYTIDNITKDKEWWHWMYSPKTKNENQ